MGWYFKDTGPHAAGSYNFWEMHHYFTGEVILLGAFYVLMELNWPDWIQWPIFILGLWVTIDDWCQHWKQKKELKKLGHYRTVSFWHWFPYWILEKI